MWTYDEFVATSYVFYKGKLNTLTVSKLLAELNIKNTKLDKLAGKFIVDGDSNMNYVKFAEGVKINDIVEFINPKLFAYLVANSKVSLGDYLYEILAMQDDEVKDKLLEKFFKLFDFSSISLKEDEKILSKK